jgi:NAD(P)-dependent dehydrogenase (short-subunit alcohol dehydrogenase family)
MSFSGMQNKVVVVTGAAQGIGAAYAQRLVAEGSKVIVADRNLEGAQATVDRISVAGADLAVAYGFDVASEEGCDGLATFIHGRFGRLDGLLNNAAVFSTIEMKPFWEITTREWDVLMAVNLKGPWLLTKALLPLLRRSEAASIVNIGSDSTDLGKTGYLHYSASKGGVRGLTFGMSHELGDLGIRVNTLSPGPVYTEVDRGTVTPEEKQAMMARQALHRAAGPEDMTSLAAFLLSDDSSYITGQTISVNGGLLHR